MSKAIDEGYLTPYKYFPHQVELSDSEFESYEKLTKELAKFYDSETETYKINDVTKIILLKRKQIIHKAF